MEEGYHNNFFSANVLIMKISGTWSFLNEDKSTRWLHISCTLFWIVCLQIYCCPTELYDLQFVYQRLDLLIAHTGVLLTHLLGNFKVFMVFHNRMRLIKLMKDLGDRRFNYNFTDEIDPYKTVESNKSTTTKTILFFMSISTVVSLSRTIPAMFVVMTMERNNLTCDDILPFLLTPPFPTGSVLTCGIAIHFQNIIIIFYAWQIITCDVLYVSCLTCLKSHFSILKNAFQSIRGRCIKALDLDPGYYSRNLHDEENPELDRMMNFEMRKASIHLQTIIGNVQIVEDIYNKIILMQVLMVVFMLVCCLYMMSTVSMFSVVFAAQMVYLIALSTQITLYCWFGDEITLAGAEVPTSIYSSDWFSASPGFKRSMLINMSRMKRDVHLTVGKFSPLTIATLVSIFRGSYSYFAVLKNVEN